MAFIIGTCSQKGGVSKTTTSVGLADALTVAGLSVLLVDTDPQAAGSVGYWCGDDWTGCEVVKDDRPELLSKLRSITGFDVIIVDTPPRLDSEIVSTVANATDLVVVCTMGDETEIIAGIQTINKLPAGTNARVLLTRCDGRSWKEIEAMQSTLRKANVATFDTAIRELKPHRKAKNRHMRPTELHGPSARKAQRDNASLGAEIQILMKHAGTAATVGAR